MSRHGFVVGINGLLDLAPLETRAAIVSGKQIVHGSKGSVSYEITIPDDHLPEAPIKFDVSLWDYDAIVPGKSKLELTVGHGLLGIEWLRSKRVAP